jgi:TP901 family phage tail tape measure protein
MASERSVVVRIRAEIGDFRRQMDQAAASTTAMGHASRTAGRDAGAATTNMGRLAASARDNGESWDKAGKPLLGFGAAVVAGVGLAIAKYAEFDKAMSEVRAATHETAGNMNLLREAAISAGADTSYSAKEAADAISELSKAGVTTKDILNGGLSGALSLAAAGSLGVADAAELGATAMTQFKLSGKDIPHIADLLSAGAGKAQGSVEDMGMALKQGGLVAAATGLSLEETTGGLAAFASAGLIGSDAGTSFKTMLQSLTPSSKESKKEMERLGISAYDSQGKFIGLSKFAGVLQTSMKGLTVEQRAASQKIIFGSDAVRASNVLYEQGAKGIADWTDKVNDSGYAASTAAIKQDNLAGDLEKLGGSFDTVLIQGGGGAATALRGIVQGAEGLIDGLGKVKPELLSMSVGFAGVAGASALIGGGFLTMLPKVLSAHAAFKALQSANAPLAGGLGKVGKAAGIAGAALAGLAIAGAIFTEKQRTSAEDYANAVMKVSAAGGNAKSSDLDSLFQGFDKFGGGATVEGINGISDAVAKLTEGGFNGWEAGVGQFFDGFTGMLNLPKSELGQLDERMKGIGETLGDLASNGGAASAAKTFRLLTGEFQKNGKGAQDALDKMPGYKDALLKLGHASGVALEPTELLDLAAGKIPARMEAMQKTTEGAAKAEEYQAKMSEEAAKKLDEMGLAADGTILSLSKLLDLMFASGMIQLSANEAAIKWQESLEAVDASITKYGRTLDITTEGGKANRRVLDGLASAGIANTKAMADNGASHEELQTNLKGTYDALLANYDKFGITGKAADDMARDVLGIPKDVPIETSIQNFADTMAKAAAVKKAVEDINPVKTIFFQTDASGFYDPTAGTDGKGAGSGGASKGYEKYFTGGLVGFAGGGKVPGTPPRNPRMDNIRAMTQNGSPYSIRSGEWVINETQSKKNDKWLRAVNGGLDLDSVFGAQSYSAPSKSMAGGYGQAQSFSGNGIGQSGGSSVTFSPQITVTGASDTGAVVQEVWGKFQFEAQKAGLRIGG